MLNILLNIKSNYDGKYENYINKYKDIFIRHIQPNRFNLHYFDNDNELINIRNISLSDLYIDNIFNDINNNTITIYYTDKLNGTIKKISDEIRLAILNSHIIPTNTNIIVSNEQLNCNSSMIAFEYNISKTNINWLFNDTILNILLNKITNTINNYANILTTYNFDFIDTHTKAIDLFTCDKMANIEKILPLIKKYQKNTGLLTSVSLGQFAYETDYGTSELLLNANNCFGMKAFISNNNWLGSCWSNYDTYTKESYEQDNSNNMIKSVSQFRKYDDIESSIVDHCSYLLNAKKSSGYRYSNINKCKNYQEACDLLSKGEYSTYNKYGNNVAEIIAKYNFDKYDD